MTVEGVTENIKTSDVSMGIADGRQPGLSDIEQVRVLSAIDAFKDVKKIIGRSPIEFEDLLCNIEKEAELCNWTDRIKNCVLFLKCEGIIMDQIKFDWRNWTWDETIKS